MSRLSGTFWIPGTDHRVGGWLDLDQGRPILELAGQLTDPMQEAAPLHDAEGGPIKVFAFGSTVELRPVTVFGALNENPSRVTIVDAVNLNRHIVIMGDAPSIETLEGDYVLRGGHINSGVEARFTAARLRLRHLDSWAQIDSITGESRLDAEHGEFGVGRVARTQVVYEQPPDAFVELQYPGGQLGLASVMSRIPRSSVQGIDLRTSAELRWLGPAEGLTMDEVWAQLVHPLELVLSLAVDAENPPVVLHVRDTHNQWVRVHDPRLENDVSDIRPVAKVLVTREQLDLTHMSRWLEQAVTLSPIPQLVANAVATSPGRAVELQLLDLATAAEGLHRRLRPTERVMPRSQAERVSRDARYAVLPEFRERVGAALGHLYELTYRERLRRLVENAQSIVPGVAGGALAEAWIDRIVGSRNGFAHQLTAERDPTAELHEIFVLAGTLKWLLTILLFEQAGMDTTVLAKRIKDHPPYRLLTSQCRDWLPEIYQQPGIST